MMIYLHTWRSPAYVAQGRALDSGPIAATLVSAIQIVLLFRYPLFGSTLYESQD